MVNKKKILLLLIVFGLLTSCILISNASADYVGSINSDVYHYSWCNYVDRINSENLVYFDSPEDAISDGYRPCKVCTPPTLSYPTSTPTPTPTSTPTSTPTPTPTPTSTPTPTPTPTPTTIDAEPGGESIIVEPTVSMEKTDELTSDDKNDTPGFNFPMFLFIFLIAVQLLRKK